MNIKEFSSTFSTLINSYAHNGIHGEDSSKADLRFDEYEKSVFLTDGQEDVALSLYTGRNPYGLSFEQTEEVRRYLSGLLSEKYLEEVPREGGLPIGIGSSSKFFSLPDDLWFMVYESAFTSGSDCGEGYQIEAVPITSDEYHRVRKNPFRGANGRRALRLDISEDIIEVVSKYDVTSYYVRYLRKLKPIILTHLDDTNIRGLNVPTECELPDILHQKILERAVQLAVQSRGYTIRNENN